MVLGKKMEISYRTDEPIFVGLVEKSDLVIVMDTINEAQRVATGKRMCESHRKDGDMVMALCGLPSRPKPDEPALDEVPLRVSAESKVPWRDLPDAAKPRAPEVESRGILGTLNVALVAQQLRQDRRMLVRQQIEHLMEAEDGRSREADCVLVAKADEPGNRSDAAVASTDLAGSKHVGELPSLMELDTEKSTATRCAKEMAREASQPVAKERSSRRPRRGGSRTTLAKKWQARDLSTTRGEGHEIDRDLAPSGEQSD